MSAAFSSAVEFLGQNVVEEGTALLALTALVWYVAVAYSIKQRGKWKWVLHIGDRFRHPAVHAAVVISLSVIVLSMVLAYGTPYLGSGDIVALVTSPGLVAVLFATIFTVWTYLTTIIIGTQQEERRVSMNMLLQNVNRTLAEELREARGEPEGAPKHTFLMMEYAPAIGILAAPAEYERFKGLVGEMYKSGLFEVDVACLPSEKVRAFHKKMKAPDEVVENVERWIYRIDTSNQGAVWRSEEIGPVHTIIIDDIAFQYAVVPVPNGTESTATGIKTEDKFLVEYLRRMIDSCLRAAVTPSLRWHGDELKATFIRQDNVEKVTVDLRPDDNFSARRNENKVIEKEPVMGDGVLVVSLSEAEVGANQYMRVELLKESGGRRQSSEICFIESNGDLQKRGERRFSLESVNNPGSRAEPAVFSSAK